MEMHTWHRGRLIDHIQIVVRDYETSKKFYSAVFEALGIPISGEAEGYFFADEFVFNQGEPLTGRTHVAFRARDRATVDRFYHAALAAGGRDNGAPGIRPYHPHYYAAFVLDPDGNNIEAVDHGPATRSAESVVITARD
jgi:catechol 2,3-dioxygenase-like lactoylglutathione lyase family enzyme